MRILVVANEHQVIQTLQQMLAGMHTGIEIVGSTSGIQETIEQVVKKKKPDLVLVHKKNDIPNPGNPTEKSLHATVTFSTLASRYNFGAFHIHKKQEIPAVNTSATNYALFIESPSPFLSMPVAPAAKVDVQGQAERLYRKRFLVKQGQRFLSIDISQIAFFFSEDRFIFLKTKDNHKYLIEYRIEELEGMLDPEIFFRINRSYLIAIHAVDQVHSYHGNRLKLFLNPPPEKEVIVSRERVHNFRLWLGE